MAILNDSLHVSEAQLTEACMPTLPSMFVVGAPRTGTTLLMQLLAASGSVCYPTNLVARFYANTYIGATIELLLKHILPPIKWSFQSSFGKTNQWYEPSEFGFFWEHHFPLAASHQLSQDSMSNIRLEDFFREIGAFHTVFHKPLAMKAMIMNYNLELLSTVPNSRFVRIVRNTTDVVYSIWRARRSLLGSDKQWLSCKPENWKQLSELTDPVEQIVAQVKSIDQAISEAWLNLEGRCMTIEYGELCASPVGEVRRVESFIGTSAVDTRHRVDRIPSKFDASSPFVPNALEKRIMKRIEEYDLPDSI